MYRQAELREVGPPCPRCAAVLRGRKLGPLHVLECAGCLGLWLARADMKKLVPALAQVVGEPARRAPVVEPAARLPCPTCHKSMRRRAFRKKSGITVDECAAHGVWFDVHELNAALAFLVRQAAAKPSQARTKAPAKSDGAKPAKVAVGGPSGETTLRQAVRVLWKAFFGELLREPKVLSQPRRPKSKKPTTR